MRFRRINRRLASIHGRSVRQHLGRTPREVVPEIAEQTEARYRTVIETGRPLRNRRLTAILPSDPGVERTWLVSDHPFTPRGGTVEGVMSVVEEASPVPARGIRRRLDTLLRQRHAMNDLIDRLPVGLMLVDGHGAILHMNAEARRILDRDDGLRARPDLRAQVPDSAIELKRLVARATREGDRAREGALRLPRPSGASPLEIAVSPVRHERAGGTAPALALCAVSDGEGRLEGNVATLRQLYGLTPTEAGIALQLARGLSLKQAARERGIRVGTARTHLKHILDKTGTRRQPELMRLLLTGPALIGRK